MKSKLSWSNKSLCVDLWLDLWTLLNREPRVFPVLFNSGFLTIQPKTPDIPAATPLPQQIL